MLAELSLRKSSAQWGRVSPSKSECPLKAGPPQCPPGKEPHQVQGVGPTGLTELPSHAQPIEGLRLCLDRAQGHRSPLRGWAGRSCLLPSSPSRGSGCVQTRASALGPNLSAKA